MPGEPAARFVARAVVRVAPARGQSDRPLSLVALEPDSKGSIRRHCARERRQGCANECTSVTDDLLVDQEVARALEHLHRRLDVANRNAFASWRVKRSDDDMFAVDRDDPVRPP